jgi:hypothetical protein
VLRNSNLIIMDERIRIKLYNLLGPGLSGIGKDIRD